MVKNSAKLLVLGDGAVGKTSIVNRYVDDQFQEDYIATIGVNLKTKTLEEKDITLSIWDLYGQRSLSPGKHSSNYIGAEGAMLVFDSTRKVTLNHLDRWMEDLFKVVGKIPVIFLGNKKDLIKEFRKEEDVGVQGNKKEFHRYIVDNHYVKSIYNTEPKFVPVAGEEVKEWLSSRENTLPDNFSFFFTSAKTGQNIDKAFSKMADYIIQNQINYDV